MHGQRMFPDHLPLELCDLSMWLVLIALLTLKPAVFDAVGVRMGRVPVTPSRLRAAMLKRGAVILRILPGGEGQVFAIATPQGTLRADQPGTYEIEVAAESGEGLVERTRHFRNGLQLFWFEVIEIFVERRAGVRCWATRGIWTPPSVVSATGANRSRATSPGPPGCAPGTRRPSGRHA